MAKQRGGKRALFSGIGILIVVGIIFAVLGGLGYFSKNGYGENFGLQIHDSDVDYNCVPVPTSIIPGKNSLEVTVPLSSDCIDNFKTLVIEVVIEDNATGQRVDTTIDNFPIQGTSATYTKNIPLTSSHSYSGRVLVWLKDSPNFKMSTTSFTNVSFVAP